MLGGLLLLACVGIVVLYRRQRALGLGRTYGFKSWVPTDEAVRAVVMVNNAASSHGGGGRGTQQGCATSSGLHDTAEMKIQLYGPVVDAANPFVDMGMQPVVEPHCTLEGLPVRVAPEVMAGGPRATGSVEPSLLLTARSDQPESNLGEGGASSVLMVAAARSYSPSTHTQATHTRGTATTAHTRGKTRALKWEMASNAGSVHSRGGPASEATSSASFDVSGVVWCGVVWCGVVWCGVDTFLRHEDFC